jgi:hypothetical protein
MRGADQRSSEAIIIRGHHHQGRESPTLGDEHRNTGHTASSSTRP